MTSTAMARVLLVASTTGYQVRSFDAAAARLGVELLLATDRCHVLDDPWRDRAVPVRFDDGKGSVRAIVDAVSGDSVDGVLALGDRPAVLAAEAAEALGLPASPRRAVRAAGNKLLTRLRFERAGVPHPRFAVLAVRSPSATTLQRVTFPCVVKPLALSASRGVMRADSRAELLERLERVRRLMESTDLRAEGHCPDAVALVEEFIPGREVAVEGVLRSGRLQVLAIFDKPDPLDGPFFEETIYVTPTRLPETERRQVTTAVVRAIAALGLDEGPIHAECRLGVDGVFVLEVANRPIGGLCARALRFDGPSAHSVSLEHVLLVHALGRSVEAYHREQRASGVMMIPIATDGVYKGVDGVEEAGRVDGIDDVVITAKRDQRIRPAPEGGSYLGFIFARGDEPLPVVEALRASHGRLRFDIAPALPLLEPPSRSRASS